MTVMERIGLEAIGAFLLLAAALAWWQIHNRNEQRAGAQACIESTTVDKRAAAAAAANTEAAQSVDINAVVRGYDAKVANLASSNDVLARRLSAVGALCANGVPGARGAAGAKPADAGLSGGQSAAGEGLVQRDLAAVLRACDANQVKTEDLAEIYEGVRARAAAAAAAP